MTSTFVFDPTREILRVNETRLNRLLLHDPQRCATLSEYATATGIDIDTVAELFGDALDTGDVSLEIWGDELFLMTAPGGRPAPPGRPQVAPNLWEVLRQSAPVEYAYALWRLVRGLEAAGWTVETTAGRILFGLGPLTARPYLGVQVQNTVVPVLVLPTAEQLASKSGLLAEYERAGAAAAAVVCEYGALDEMVTAVRRWVLSNHYQPTMHVLILESPRYNPTVLSPDDAAVLPRTVTRTQVEQLGWTQLDTPHTGLPSSPSGYGR